MALYKYEGASITIRLFVQAYRVSVQYTDTATYGG